MYSTEKQAREADGMKCFGALFLLGRCCRRETTASPGVVGDVDATVLVRVV